MAIKVDLSLEEFIPDEYEMPLLVEGKPVMFTLRSFDLSDFKWLKKVSGKSPEHMGEALQDFDTLAKMVYRLVKEKDKLEPVKAVEYDDAGVKKEVTKSGPDRLLSGINLRNQKVLVQVLTQMMNEALPASEVEAADFKKKQATQTQAVQGV